jgi:uncharacterized Zn finger protein (UPF0148 family)
MPRCCGRCHTCGTVLHSVLDGEEWCPRCQTYRRYRSHGWATMDAEPASWGRALNRRLRPVPER